MTVQEPWVQFDIECTALQIAQSPRDVWREQALNQVHCRRINVVAKLDLACQDLFVNANMRGVIEGWVAREHLVDEYAKRPPVDRLAVSTRLDDFWSQVLWRATQSPRPVINVLCKAKVSDLDVSLVV